MNKGISRRLLAVGTGSALTAALLLTPSDSFADGATTETHPFQDSYCFNHEGYTICYESRGVVSQTQTPSGNTAFVGTGTTSYTQTDSSGNVVFQDNLQYLTQGLQMEGVLAQLGQRSKSSVTIGNSTCTTYYVFHYANGMIQVDHSTECK